LSNYALKQTGGEETHTLNINEIPPHNHTVGIGGGNRDASPASGNSEGYASNRCCFSSYTSNAGSGYAHNNLPPFYALTYIIKY
jgi:microcystin-dependent protein